MNSDDDIAPSPGSAMPMTGRTNCVNGPFHFAAGAKELDQTRWGDGKKKTQGKNNMLREISIDEIAFVFGGADGGGGDVGGGDISSSAEQGGGAAPPDTSASDMAKGAFGGFGAGVGATIGGILGELLGGPVAGLAGAGTGGYWGGYAGEVLQTGLTDIGVGDPNAAMAGFCPGFG